MTVPADIQIKFILTCSFLDIVSMVTAHSLGFVQRTSPSTLDLIKRKRFCLTKDDNVVYCDVFSNDVTCQRFVMFIFPPRESSIQSTLEFLAHLALFAFFFFILLTFIKKKYR